MTAAELLSVAAFDEGRNAQAFPTFGSERTRAPVVSFCRIDDRPIRLREPITDPDALIVQDPTLVHQVDIFAKAVWDHDEQRLISDAEIAEIDYTAFTSRPKADHIGGRLIVRRVKRLNPKAGKV